MSFRLALLRQAWRRGPLDLLQQGGSMVLGCGPLIPVLAFERDCFDNLRVPQKLGINVEFEDYRSWRDIPMSSRQQVVEFSQKGKVTAEQMLAWGWRLWVGFRNHELAIVGWTRSHEQSRDFFFPLSGSSALVWYTETLAPHRGRGLMPLMLDHMVDTLRKEGITRAYATCATYNQASRRGIEKAHFKLIGKGLMRAGSGRGVVWFPSLS